MNFYDYMFGANKKSVTDFSEKTVCDEVSEKSVKDALVEGLEETETEKTAEDDKAKEKDDTVTRGID